MRGNENSRKWLSSIVIGIYMLSFILAQAPVMYAWISSAVDGLKVSGRD
jgi:hypothetical protein